MLGMPAQASPGGLASAGAAPDSTQELSALDLETAEEIAAGRVGRSGIAQTMLGMPAQPRPSPTSAPPPPPGGHGGSNGVTAHARPAPLSVVEKRRKRTPSR